MSFVAIAYAPAWLLTLPLWLTGEGLSWTWAPVVLVLMMFMPAVAALVVNKWVSPQPKPLRSVGFTNPGGIKRWWRFALLAWLGPPLVMTFALFVGNLLGVYPLTTGVLWGLWHAPVLVLGYNYPTVPAVVAFIMMMCFCTLVGVLLAWLRLASRSVWPAAIAHGFLNASAGLSVVFSAAGHPVDNTSVGLLGWSGWIVLAVLVLVLVMLGKLPVELPVEKRGISRGVRRLSRR